MLTVDTRKQKAFLTTCHQLSTLPLRKSLQNQYLYTQSFLHKQKLQQLLMYESSLSQSLTQLKQYIQTSLQSYETLEQQLQIQASNLASVYLSGAVIAKATSSSNTTFTKDQLGFTYDFSHNISLSKDPKSYLTKGITMNLDTEFYGLQYKAEKQSKYLKGSAAFALVKGEIDTEAKIVLFQDDKFNPVLHLSVAGEAALASASVGASLGNRYVNAQMEGKVGLGVAYGEATAVISTEEVTMKAEVGAAAVKGEVSGGITLFGLNISLTGSGELGAVGASAEFSKKEGEFTFGGKASLIAGLGFKITVKYK